MERATEAAPGTDLVDGLTPLPPRPQGPGSIDAIISASYGIGTAVGVGIIANPVVAGVAIGACLAAGSASVPVQAAREARERFAQVFGAHGDESETEVDDEDFDPDLMEEKNVLVLGVSQSGKSSLIGSLMQNQHPKQTQENHAKFKQGHKHGYDTFCVEDSSFQAPKIGYGDRSCTTGVSVFELFKPCRPTHILEADPPPSEMGSWLQDFQASGDAINTRSRKLLEKWKKHPTYAANLRFGPPLSESAGVQHLGGVATRKRKLRIRLIDTPGMMDTGGNDDTYMADILERLASEDKAFQGLAAIVMVTKMGATPFNPEWLRHIHRYWKQFKPLQSQFIFVHTNCDPAGITSKLERQKNDACFESCIWERARICQAYFANAEHDMDRDELFQSLSKALHIFYESCVPVDEDGKPEPGAEVVQHWQMRSTNQLLKAVATMPTVRLDCLTLAKGPDMLRVDHKMAASLDAEIATSIQTMRELGEELSAFMQWFLRHTKEIAEITARLDQVKNELVSLDCKTLEVTERKGLLAESLWFTKGEASNSMAIDATCPEDMMSRALDWSQEGEVSLNECSNGLWKVKAGSKSGWFYYYSIAGEMVLKVAKAHLHRDVIAEKKRLRQEYERQLQQKEEEKNAQKALEDGKKVKQQSTEKRMQECQIIRNFIARDMTLAEFKVLKNFYCKARMESWEGQKCHREFQSAEYKAKLPSVFGWEAAEAAQADLQAEHTAKKQQRLHKRSCKRAQSDGAHPSPSTGARAQA